MIPRYGEWASRFAARGLTVIGVHTPETDGERDRAALTAFLRDNHVAWDTLVDPDRAVWDRYGVEAWPTIVLVDRHGLVRARFVGDDRSPAIERTLLTLLAEK